MADSAETAQQTDKRLPIRRRLLDWSKEKVFGGLLVAVTAIGITWWVNSQIASLSIQVGAVRSVAENLGRFEVTLENDGSRSVEDVELEIKLARGTIKSAVPHEDSSLFKAHTAINEAENQCFITIARMNRGEAFTITVSASDPFEMDKRVSIAARAKDVQTKRSNGSGSTTSGPWLMFKGFAVLVVGLAAFIFLGAWLSFVADRQKARLKALYLSRAPKLISFLNGPLRGRYCTGKTASDLYDAMDESHTRLEIEGFFYYRWALHDSESGVVKLELVCDDSEITTEWVPLPEQDEAADKSTARKQLKKKRTASPS